jgi:hypothetical protein
MNAKILPLPQPWIANSQHAVTVEVDGATPGGTATIDLFRAMPKPDLSLGSKTTSVTSSGTASATFQVTLSSPGVNVLHCEVVSGSDTDSDSAGTIVT